MARPGAAWLNILHGLNILHAEVPNQRIYPGRSGPGNNGKMGFGIMREWYSAKTILIRYETREKIAISCKDSILEYLDGRKPTLVVPEQKEIISM